VVVLDRASLVDRLKVIVSGKPDESELYRLVRDGVMPPGDHAKADAVELRTLSDWIRDGAPEPTSPYGEAYVLAQIVQDLKTAPRNARFAYRYVSFVHLLEDGVSPDVCAAALALAVNHLSLADQPVRPFTVDPTGMIFRLDLKELGWADRPFTGSTRIYYDLLLLEYPFAAALPPSDDGKALSEGYLDNVAVPFVRPIAYVRGDWLVSVATQAPLYDDLLQLPRTLQDVKALPGLETVLKVNPAGAKRAAVLGSGGHARLIERSAAKPGPYWRTYELDGVGDKAALRGRLLEKEAPAQVLFGLPNGLLGYALFDARGRRLEAAPTEWVTDPHAPADLVPRGQARVGLSCLRCHDSGPHPFPDDLGDAASGAAWDKQVKADAHAYVQARKAALDGKVPEVEPLTVISELYQKTWVRRPTRRDVDKEGARRRDESLFQPSPLDALPKQLARGADGPPALLLPLDGLTYPQYEPADGKVRVKLETLNGGKPATVFHPGDEFQIRVVNTGDKPVSVEVYSFDLDKGRAVSLPPLGPGTTLGPGESKFFPSADKPLTIPKDTTGADAVTLFASLEPFPAGVVLRNAEGRVGDRVVHPFYQPGAGKGFNPSRMLKRTIVVEYAK
jgi:hypothetical protein